MKIVDFYSLLLFYFLFVYTFVRQLLALSQKGITYDGLFCFVIAHRNYHEPHQSYQVFLVAYQGHQFGTKSIKFLRKCHNFINTGKPGNHPFREKVMNSVILSNEQQLFKHSSYISKLELFPQKFQEIQD